MLFSLLDYEVDPCVLSDIHDTITSIMHSMVADKLTSWLHLCREVHQKFRTLGRNLILFLHFRC